MADKWTTVFDLNVEDNNENGEKEYFICEWETKKEEYEAFSKMLKHSFGNFKNDKNFLLSLNFKQTSKEVFEKYQRRNI